ncbi:hypothetical protein DM01DRAFT_1396942 [Hesseltinella vesiculosa]|uniref:Uncharacterized protein n=1 Tax=Hesseltinella vesiculosa TaxID=101127 RepID=A0A1X2G6V5_9FUNG|nr:hypothetical protein DM01DRAFT_1396942 [Hesseltinella vesiculosa]
MINLRSGFFLLASLLLLLVCTGLVCADEDKEPFCIEFFHAPQLVDKNGFVCDNATAGVTAGRPKKYLSTVASFSAPDWLQVTLYSDFFFRGTGVQYQGSVDSIDPPMIVKSVQYENTN